MCGLPDVLGGDKPCPASKPYCCRFTCATLDTCMCESHAECPEDRCCVRDPSSGFGTCSARKLNGTCPCAAHSDCGPESCCLQPGAPAPTPFTPGGRGTCSPSCAECAAANISSLGLGANACAPSGAALQLPAGISLEPVSSPTACDNLLPFAQSIDSSKLRWFPIASSVSGGHLPSGLPSPNASFTTTWQATLMTGEELQDSMELWPEPWLEGLAGLVATPLAVAAAPPPPRPASPKPPSPTARQPPSPPARKPPSPPALKPPSPPAHKPPSPPALKPPSPPALKPPSPPARKPPSPPALKPPSPPARKPPSPPALKPPSPPALKPPSPPALKPPSPPARKPPSSPARNPPSPRPPKPPSPPKTAARRAVLTAGTRTDLDMAALTTHSESMHDADGLTSPHSVYADRGERLRRLLGAVPSREEHCENPHSNGVPPELNGCGPSGSPLKLAGMNFLFGNRDCPRLPAVPGLEVPIRLATMWTETCTSFKPCCDGHDRCYSECSRAFTQQRCDNEMYQCTMASCASGAGPRECAIVANMYYSALQLGGKSAWEAAQNKHCICADPPSPPSPPTPPSPPMPSPSPPKPPSPPPPPPPPRRPPPPPPKRKRRQNGLLVLPNRGEAVLRLTTTTVTGSITSFKASLHLASPSNTPAATTAGATSGALGRRALQQASAGPPRPPWPAPPGPNSAHGEVTLGLPIEALPGSTLNRIRIPLLIGMTCTNDEFEGSGPEEPFVFQGLTPSPMLRQAATALRACPKGVDMAEAQALVWKMIQPQDEEEAGDPDEAAGERVLQAFLAAGCTGLAAGPTR
ncbi:hypothetical protein HYH03_001048 [Edaphochlamys debaryana]|uniref:Uncharacterized protein n=1 Tax=Edaphochlamys debaryana TaxID=47281 RepID=A0A835YEU9_9CHLO|nr:hypothetical protein HYH03_001048 [Edaphochlamys debaryana]|eukprot:KAG2501241.1 hypothetical protein HYH03_001048 [Edaphochlamys debaryana]